MFEPCSPGALGGMQVTLAQLAEQGKASQVCHSDDTSRWLVLFAVGLAAAHELSMCCDSEPKANPASMV